jgi:hypothetical protein
MFVIGFVFVAWCVLALVASRLAPVNGLPSLLVFTALFLCVSQVSWATILFLNFVPLDKVGRSFDVYLEPWYRTIGLVPPIVGAVVFAIAAWGRRRPRERKTSR